MNSLPKTHHYHQFSFTHHHSSLQTSFSTFSFPSLPSHQYSSSPLLLPYQSLFLILTKKYQQQQPFSKTPKRFFPIVPNPFQQQLLFEQPTYVTARDIFFF
jgi:hypothetical protein